MKKLVVIILSALFIYFYLLNYPSIIFKKSFQCQGFEIHYNFLNDPEKFCEFLDSIKQNYQFLDSNISNIYLPDSDLKYKILSLFSKELFWINPVRGLVFIAPFNFESRKFFDSSISFTRKFNEIVLSSLLFNKYGALEYIATEKWKIRGYAWYVSNEIDEFSINDLCAGGNNLKGYYEFENMLVVKYIIEREGYKPIALFNDNISYELSLKDMKRLYCR